MIRNISTGQGLTIMGGNSSPPYFNMNTYTGTSIVPGTIRYNGNNSNFEVYDGHMWMTLPSNSAVVELDLPTKEIIEWAKAKKAEEEYLFKKHKDNPTGIDLLNKRKSIDEKIQIVLTLLREEEKV